MNIKLLNTLCLLPLTLNNAQAETKEQRPNVLLIIADDFSSRIGCYGDSVAKTPNLDAFASTAARFSNAYANGSVSTPSRKSLLTGLKTNVVGAGSNNFIKANPNTMTMPRWFRENGYHTAKVGKIEHIGSNGVMEYTGPYCWSNILDTMATFPNEGNPKTVIQTFNPSGEAKIRIYADNSKTSDEIREEGFENFINNMWDKSKPFFFGLGFHSTHLPYDIKQRHWDMYVEADMPLTVNPTDATPTSKPFTASTYFPGVPASKQKEFVHGYYAAASMLDEMVGKALQFLDEKGLTDNTIVVFLSDQGYFLGYRDLWSKHYCYPEVLNAPLLVRYPGMPNKGKTVKGLVEFLDLFPTLNELAGLPLVANLPGKSFVNQLNNPEDFGKDAVYLQGATYGEFNVTSANYMYQVNGDKDELYNLSVDPKAYYNIAASNSAEKQKHYQLLAGYFNLSLTQSLAGKGTAANPYQIGSAEDLFFLSTKINAKDTAYSNLNKHYVLMDNVDFADTGISWEPIGKAAATPFRGVFDGKDKHIKGFSLGNSGTTTNAVFGLFGVCDSAIVKNLYLDNIDMSFNYTATNDLQIGSLCAVAKNSTLLSNVAVTGKINIESTSSNIYCGGIAGMMVTLSNVNPGPKIINSYSAVNISAKCLTTSSTLKLGAGGICGSTTVNAGSERPKIINSYSTGSITANGGSQTVGVGGIAGNNSPDIMNCYSASKIKSNATNTASVVKTSGIAGIRGGTLTSCIALNDSVSVNSPGTIVNNRIVDSGTANTLLYANPSLVSFNNGTQVNITLNKTTTGVNGADLTSLNPETILNSYVNDNPSLNFKNTLYQLARWENGTNNLPGFEAGIKSGLSLHLRQTAFSINIESRTIRISIHDSSQASCTLFDVNGRKLVSGKIPGNSNEELYNVSTSGMYFIKITTSDSTFTKKIIIF